MNPDIECYILSRFLNEYKTNLETYRNIYLNTKKYFKFLELKDKLMKDVELIKIDVEIYKDIENNYKNRLVSYKIKEPMFDLTEKCRDIIEDITFIDKEIAKLNYDTIIYANYQFWEVEVDRISKKLAVLNIKVPNDPCKLEYELL